MSKWRKERLTWFSPRQIWLEKFQSWGGRTTSLSRGAESQCSDRRVCSIVGVGTVDPPAAAAAAIANALSRTPTVVGSRGSGVQQSLQSPGLALFLGLLPAQSHLCGHDALALCNQGALGARTVPPAAETLMALERRHHAVVATAGTLWCPRIAAAQRAHTPLQPWSPATFAPGADGGGTGRPQIKSGGTQKSWRNGYPGSDRQVWRQGWRCRHPQSSRGQVKTAAAFPEVTLGLLHSQIRSCKKVKLLGELRLDAASGTTPGGSLCPLPPTQDQVLHSPQEKLRTTALLS